MSENSAEDGQLPANPVPHAIAAVAKPRPVLAGRVLVVDDDGCLRSLLANMLRICGAEVVIRGNGLEAVAEAQANHFDLVLMDLNMPIMDGLTAAECIRDAGIDVPLIAVTGNDVALMREQCLQAGFDKVIGKPINRDELLQSCAECLGRAALSKC